MRVLCYANGQVATVPGTPPAEAFAVADGRFAWVGSVAELRARGEPFVDLGGRTVVPGLIDPHLHLLGTAARRLGLDCSPAAAPDRVALLERVREQAERVPPGTWIRAYGLDATAWEGGPPTARQLDTVAPAHPVLLQDASGHAAIINSQAATALGVRPTPAGFWVDPVWPQPPPRLPAAALRAALAAVGEELLAYGITHVSDVSPENGPAALATLSAWAADGTLPVGVSLYVNPQNAPWEGSAADAREAGAVRVCGVKYVLSERRLDDALAARLRRDLAAAQASGRQTTMHVVDLPTLAWLLDLAQAAPGLLAGQRLEHLSLCPPGWEAVLAAAGVHVVTQPAFLWERGEKYRREIAEHCWEWLYPVGRLLTAGVSVAASSDSPVAGLNPFQGMRSAAERRTAAGHRLGPAVPLSRADALALYTTGAAAALGAEHERGRIAPGYRASFAVLDADPLTCEPAALPDIRSLLTCVDGVVRRQRLPIHA